MTAPRSLEDEVQELLARLHSFDDKPHQLFSHLRAMALRHCPEWSKAKTVEIADRLYENIGGILRAAKEHQAASDSSMSIAAREGGPL